MKRTSLIFEFLIVMIGVALLLNFQKLNLTNIYFFIYIPLMIVTYGILTFPLKQVFLRRYISYPLAFVLSIITIGKALENSGIVFNSLTIVSIIISIIGLVLIFERTFQILLQLSIAYNIIGNRTGITWKHSFFLIFICWLLYLLPFLPGNVAGDGNFQLLEFFGHASMTNHHPFLSTVFQGGIFNIGKVLVNDNFGLFLYVVVQLLICCLIYSFCISKVSKLGINKHLCIAFSLFVGLSPYWSFVSETFHKDGMFIAFFALFITLLLLVIVDLLIDRENKISTKQLVSLTISGLLVCLWRNDGIYMVLPSIFCLIFVDKRHYWKQFTGIFLAICAVYIGFNKVLLPSLHVAPTEKREALSLPVQQTARYLKEYPQDVTQHEKKVLADTFDNSTKLGTRYDPNIADPVKFYVKDRFNLKDYLEVWLQMGFRHPLVYITATFEGTNGYYTPWLQAQTFSWCAHISSWSKPDFLKLDYLTPRSLRSSVLKLLNGISSLPFINILLSDSLAIWLCVLMGSFLWAKLGFQYLIPFIPIFMNLLICIASPVNGLIRYSGCIVFATYCLLVYYFFAIKKLRQR